MLMSHHHTRWLQHDLLLPSDVATADADVVRAVVIHQTSGHTVVSQKPNKSCLELGISGWIEAGESLRAAAAREIMEELGIRCHSFEYLATYHVPGRHGCKLRIVAMLAEVFERCPLVVGDELQMAKWAPMTSGFNELSLPEHLVLLQMIRIGTNLALEAADQLPEPMR
jgi:NADH pyrophosphatase NudC (nudix superfamily)